jgi:hypothetical protein
MMRRAVSFNERMASTILLERFTTNEIDWHLLIFILFYWLKSFMNTVRLGKLFELIYC